MVTSTIEQRETIAQDSRCGYTPVNGLNMYDEIEGSGQPLVLLHGGFGLTGMFGDVVRLLAQNRQVIAVDLQEHGRTADIDRPLRLELMADDFAGAGHTSWPRTGRHHGLFNGWRGRPAHRDPTPGGGEEARGRLDAS